MAGSTGKVARFYGYLARQFRVLQQQYPDMLEGPYGVGSMFAFTPFNGEKELVVSFTKKCFERGLICFVAGNNPIRVRFLLPIGGLTLTDIDGALSIVEQVLSEFK